MKRYQAGDKVRVGAGHWFAPGTLGEVVEVRQVVYVKLAAGPNATVTATFDADEIEPAS